jgi:hypothetical protein
MTKEQIDIYDMGLAVQNHFDDNPSPWAGNVPLTAAKATLDAKLSTIAQQHAIQLVNPTGITDNKEIIREILETQAYTLSSGISGYASVINNQDLYNRTHYTKTDLLHFREAELLGVCVNLHKDATTELANLTPYGIVAATLTAFTTAMNNFSAIMKNPIEATAKRKAATEKIAVLIPELSNFLNTTMDNLVVALTTTQAQFVDIYHNVRLINSSPTNSWSLTTTVLDSTTEQPVAGAEIHLVEENINRTTGASGFNTYINLAAGDHTIEVTHPNYQPQTLTTTILDGQTTELAIMLVP